MLPRGHNLTRKTLDNNVKHNLSLESFYSYERGNPLSSVSRPMKVLCIMAFRSYGYRSPCEILRKKTISEISNNTFPKSNTFVLKLGTKLYEFTHLY